MATSIKTGRIIYDALLDDHEDKCRLDCGCAMWRANDNSTAIKFCKTHRQADDMQDLLVDARAIIGDRVRDGSVTNAEAELYRSIKATLKSINKKL